MKNVINNVMIVRGKMVWEKKIISCVKVYKTKANMFYTFSQKKKTCFTHTCSLDFDLTR